MTITANSAPIGRCTRAELPEVVGLVNAADRGRDGQAGWTSEIGLVDGLRTTLASLSRELDASQDLNIFGLREAGELLACVRLEPATTRSGEPAGCISMLAVLPQVQDRGLGRLMLTYAESQARARGARVARMTVVSIRDSLIAWYERHGYRRTGETEPFPYQEVPFGQPLQAGLEFVVLEKSLQ